MLPVCPVLPSGAEEKGEVIMENAAMTEELPGADELDELYRLDASEAEPEDDEEDEDDDEEDDEGGEMHPEGMPNP
jgi:hypothetical protein